MGYGPRIGKDPHVVVRIYQYLSRNSMAMFSDEKVSSNTLKITKLNGSTYGNWVLNMCLSLECNDLFWACRWN